MTIALLPLSLYTLKDAADVLLSRMCSVGSLGGRIVDGTPDGDGAVVGQFVQVR